MNPIRVLVAKRPRLIRELVMATIADQPDIGLSARFSKKLNWNMPWKKRIRTF